MCLPKPSTLFFLSSLLCLFFCTSDARKITNRNNIRSPISITTAFQIPHFQKNQGRQQIRYQAEPESKETTSTSNNDDDDNNNNNKLTREQEIISQASDEDVLLACRAYLSRHHRLEWSEHEDRKSEAKRKKETLGSGVFWDSNWGDPDDEDDDDDDYYDKEEDFFDETSSSSSSDSFFRRSQALKEKWSDPEFKAVWYERRWGSSSKAALEREERRQRTELKKMMNKKKKMVRSIPLDVLQSPQLAAMTEEEVAQAIVTYKESNRRRSESLKGRRGAIVDQRRSQEEGEDEEEVDTTEKMRLAQMKRSERAKKAYQTRLANMKNKQKSSSSSSSPPQRERRIMTGDTLQDSLNRINNSLISKTRPDPEDVERILLPKRLTGRRDLLRNILEERYDLRGKCVPLVLQDGEGGDGDVVRQWEQLQFTTVCTIEQLGKFVVYKLRMEEKEEKEKGGTGC